MDDYDAGYKTGKEFAQKTVMDLMNEVIEAYKQMPVTGEVQVSHKQVQTNAVQFMSAWVRSGGSEDFDGNRACLPW